MGVFFCFNPNAERVLSCRGTKARYKIIRVFLHGFFFQANRGGGKKECVLLDDVILSQKKNPGRICVVHVQQVNPPPFATGNLSCIRIVINSMQRQWNVFMEHVQVNAREVANFSILHASFVKPS